MDFANRISKRSRQISKLSFMAWDLKTGLVRGGWSRAPDNSIGFVGCDSEEDGMTAGILWVTASVDD